MASIDKKTFNQYLTRLMLGEILTSEEQESFDAKVAEDGECREEWEKWQSFTTNFSTSFRQVTQGMTPPKSRVLSRLEMDSSRMKPRTPKQSWRAVVGFLIITTLALLFMAYGGLLLLYKIRKDQMHRQIKTDLNDLQKAVHEYKNKHGDFPNNIQNLLRKKKIDPWGQTYRMYWKKTENYFILYSIGKNGKNEYGFGDDITLEKLQLRE